MNDYDPQKTRPETLIAAILYLMTHYARSGCPRLAMCVSRHLQCLSAHPRTDPLVRDMSAGLQGAWADAAAPRAADGHLH